MAVDKGKKIIFQIFFIFFIILSLIFTELYLGEGDNKNARNFFSADKKLYPKSKSFPGLALGVEDQRWERENVFVNDNIVKLVGGDYDIINFTKVSREGNKNPVRVVIFGDGYSWGNSNPNRYSILSDLVQSKLDKELGKNVVEVTLLSASAASFYNHYDYFKGHSIDKLNPDIIIYNYFDNDILPSFNESTICRSESRDSCTNKKNDNGIFNPEYQDCIHGEGDIYSKFVAVFKELFPKRVYNVLSKHCQPIYERASKVKYDPIKAQNNPFTLLPYITVNKDDIRDLRSILKGRKLAVYKLIPFSPEESIESELLGIYKDAGWDLVPRENLITFFKKNLNNEDFRKLLQINESVGYPSTYFNNIFAADLTEYIIKNISPEKLKVAKESANPEIVDKSLVKFTMPVYNADIKNISENESVVSFDKSRNPIFEMSPDANVKFLFQHANCMNLGKSNFQINLNKNIQSGKVRLSGLPNSEDISVGIYYYDKEGRRIYREIGKYKNMLEIDIPTSSINTDLVLTFNRYSVGCPLDKIIDAPNFSLNISYIK